MKRFRFFFAALLFAVMAAAGAEAQSSLKGMGLNGATGLYTIPTGRIGWERSSDFGLDLGYHAVMYDGEATHIPKFAMSLFKWVELSAAFDFQPENYFGDKPVDFIGGLKVQLPMTHTAIALGANFQAHNFSSDSNPYRAGQVYAAVTYAGTFFNMPAETTVVLGKTFVEDDSGSNIDFGMGFDMILLPNILENYLHWILDFSNFSYSNQPFGAVAGERGVLNTGVRIALSSIPVFSRFKFAVDVMVCDAFDENRSFSAGLVFGIPVL